MTKFTRRLQRIGSSTLVSLPKEWVDAHGLQKGSRIDLDEVGHDSLSISIHDDKNRDARPTARLVISYPLPAEENIVADTTGAYLLGYDVIRIEAAGGAAGGTGIIPVRDREEVRNSMRRLVGMEIIEEDASHIEIQFLLDATTLSPAKILKRMSSIATGMCEDVTRGLISDDKSNLQTIQHRDIEVNRQYFLLVRLIRSTLADKRLADAFHLENIDILDYRVAANLLENAGDSVVELASLVLYSSLSQEQSRVIFEAVQDIEKMTSTAINAFTEPDRRLAIESIALHKTLQERLSGLREMEQSISGDDVSNNHNSRKNMTASAGSRYDKQIIRGQKQKQQQQYSTRAQKKKSESLPVDFIEIIHMYEKIARSWADVADLVKPLYNKA